MSEPITFVGMDVHKNSIHVAMLLPGSSSPVTWSQGTDAEAVRKLLIRLVKKASGSVRCCYEAGPTGYALQRTLSRQGIECMIVAPSLIPIRPGSRVKTDRRDAAKLAELFRAGLLSEVHHRCKPGVTGPILKRREGQPARILAIADRAQERLYARYLRMSGRGKEHNKTVTAMARELAGYIWAALHPDAAAMLNG